MLDLIEKLRREFSTSILFISHNLAIVARICERVGVLYAGRLIEEGSTGAIFETPRHPYTVGLLRCLPRGGRTKAQGPLDTIPGFPPSLGSTLQGCTFAERCVLADERCRNEEPPLTDLGGRRTRCYYPDQAPDMPAAAMTDFVAPPPPKTGATPILTAFPISRRLSISAATGWQLCRMSPLTCTAARHWGWSGNPAAARPHSPALCWA